MPAASLTLARRATLGERNLDQEYRAAQALLAAQPSQVQFFLQNQAQVLGEALVHQKILPGFSLPRWVVCRVGAEQPTSLPGSFCWQKLNNWRDCLRHAPLLEVLDSCLAELEREDHPAVAAGATLLRYTTARHLVHGLLPPLDSIGSEGVGSWLNLENAERTETDPATVLVDYRRVPVQPFVEVFRAAYRLAAFISVDEEYHLKQTRLLGEWLSQCRGLANYETEMLIQDLRRRVEAANLNRGLSLSLPYFDDRQLEKRLHNFHVIPAGRIPFDSHLLEAAAREEQLRVSEDPHLSAATRLHLIAELRMIEKAFHQPLSNNLKE